MQQRSVIHSTYEIRRNYSKEPRRVFSAFADPAKKRRWFVEGDGSTREGFEMDFRAGGRERVQFRLPDGSLCTNETIYQDILPDRRIVFVYTMAVGERCISSSQVTTEFLAVGAGTELVFTEQAAFFEGSDGPEIRKAGWEKLLDNFAAALAD